MTLVLLGSGAALAVTPLGPEYPVPGGPGTGHGGSTCFADTDNEAAMGKTKAANLTAGDGLTWHYGGGSDQVLVGDDCPFSATPTDLPPFDTTRFDRLFWGMSSAPTLALDGIVDAPGETMTYSGDNSDLAAGRLVWTGSTTMTWCFPGSCATFTTTPLQTRFVLTATDLAGAPVNLLDPAAVDVADPQVGGLVEVTESLTNFKVNLVAEADDPGTGGIDFTPAISMYNGYNHPNPPPVSPQTQMGFGGGFRYLSRAPEGTIGGDAPLNHQLATFSAVATDPDGTIESYAWDLDNDGTYDDGTEQTASATYGPGTHDVSVEVTDNDGVTTQLFREFTIENALPVAAFGCTPDPVSVEQVVTCTSDSFDPDAALGDPALLLEWDVDTDGDLDFVGDEVITPSFSEPGDHTITLFVTDRDGGNSMTFETVTVQDTVAPVASLVLAKARLGAIIKNGIKGTLTVDEASTASLKATIAKKLARKLKIKPVIGRATADAPAAGDVPVTVKLTRAAKRKLKTLGKVAIKVTAVVTDLAGNTSTTTASRTYQK